MLSYAFLGLSDKEVLRAFRELLSLNPNDRSTRYAAWFEASKANLESSVANSISTAMKLDLTNAVQRQLLCDVCVARLSSSHTCINSLICHIDHV